MKPFKYLVLIVLCFGVLSVPVRNTLAQTKSPQVEAVAEVNIQGAKIANQIGGVVNISFLLTNGKGVQTGVKYSVRLYSKTNRNIIVDEKVYEESLTLPENSQTRKNIVYTVPATLSGTYSLYIFSNNVSGFPFGVVNLGDVTFTATQKGISVMPESCTTSVVDAKEKKSHTLSESPVLIGNELLKLSCTAQNTSAGVLSFIPTYQTFYRTLGGEKAETIGGDVAPVSLKAGEKKVISLTLPKGQEPQMYVTQITFGEGQSNNIVVRHSIGGATVNIVNVSSDKDYYKAGNKAKLTLLWSAPALPLFADVMIKTGKGALCGKSSGSEVADGKSNIEVSIKRPCFDPSITLSLKNKSGTVLDEKTFDVKTTSVQEFGGIFGGAKGPILILVILIAIVALGRYLKKNKVTSSGAAPLAAIAFIVTLLSFSSAHAFTYPGIGAQNNIYVTVNVDNVNNPGSNTYSQNDPMYITGSVTSSSTVDESVSLSAITINLNNNNPVQIFNPPSGVITVGPSLPFYNGQAVLHNVSVPTNPPLPQTFSVDFSAGIDEVENPIYVTITTESSGLPWNYGCWINYPQPNGSYTGSWLDGNVTTTYTAHFWNSVSDYNNDIPLDVTNRNLKLKYDYNITCGQPAGCTGGGGCQGAGNFTAYTPILSGTQAFVNTSYTEKYAFGQYVPQDCEYCSEVPAEATTVLDGLSETVPYQLIPVPPTASISAPPGAYTNEPFDITWNSTAATECTKSFTSGSATSGTVSVTQSSPTTYTVTCSNIAGSDMKTVDVDDWGVYVPPPQCWVAPGSNVPCPSPNVCEPDPMNPGFNMCVYN